MSEPPASAPRWINSADSHVNEPDDLWERPLLGRWGDLTPRVVQAGALPGNRPERAGETGRLYFTGEAYLPLGLAFDDDMAKRIRRTNTDPVYRAACMDEDGVWAELLFPTRAMMLFGLRNTALARDCLAVYNDWLAEYCSAAPVRMLGAALIHMEDVDRAIAELARNAARGMRCAMINADVRPEWAPYRDRRYDRFWAAAQEMRMPLAIHIATGAQPDIFFFAGDRLGEAGRGFLNLMSEAAHVIGNEFILGGIFDRFPDLNLYVVEYEASWLPHWLYRMEQLAGDFGPSLGLPPLPRPMRDYLGQLYIGVIDDPLVRSVTDTLDPRRLVWGSDFPHVRNTHLKSHRVVSEVFGHLDAATVRAIATDNAARLFRIEMPSQRPAP